MIHHSFLNALRELSAYDHFRVSLPWFWWSDRDDYASRLHSRALTLRGSGTSSRGGLARGVGVVLHSLRMVRQIIVTWLHFGRATAEAYGFPRWRHWTGLIVTVFRFNLPPAIYYKLRLFRMPRSEWGNVFSHAETTALLTALARAKGGAERWDKTGWWDFCRERGLPSVPVLVEVQGDRLDWKETTAAALELGGEDLFIKPVHSFSSHGAALLEWDPKAEGWKVNGAVSGFVRRGELVRFLQQHSQSAAIVVQPRLYNEDSLADLAVYALVNIRVMTLRDAEGRVSVLLAMLRMPPANQVASDVVGSTWTVRVDPDTGLMGPIESGQLGFGERPMHPATGRPIAGRRVESWAEMKRLALHAHTLVPDMPVVGWDLVATTQGVMILEANAVWHGLLGQAWGRQPLGSTAWAELMDAHLGRSG